MRKVVQMLGASLSAPLALILGLCVTAMLFTSTKRLEDDKVALAFEQRAELSASAVRRGIDEAMQVLSVLNQLFMSVDHVTREQFRTFTRPLWVRYPYIQAFNFHRMLAGEARAPYERAMALSGYYRSDFRISGGGNGAMTPAPLKERYYIVDYLEPLRGNEPALGLDVSGNAAVMSALVHAVESNAPASTDLLQLAQSMDDHGFLVMIPVYRAGTDLTDVAARRKNLIGDTAAVFRAGHLVQKTLQAANLLADPDVAIDVYSDSVGHGRQLLFHHDISDSAAPPQGWAPIRLFYERPRVSAHPLLIAGQHWEIVVSSTPALITQNHLGSLLVLIAGVLFTMMATAYTHTLALRSRRVEKLVEEKTVELRLTNELLSEDILARQQAEMALKLRERAIEASANAILILRADGADYPIEYVNPAFERITGYSAEEVAGRGLRAVDGNRSDPDGLNQIYTAMHEQREANTVLRNYRKDGSLLWCDFYVAPVRDAAGEVSHFVAALYDITSMKRYESELEFQASRDTLTGLANRVMLHDALSKAIVQARQEGETVWVVFVDLDRFKFINDTLGHRAGDLLLKTLARRLYRSLRPFDTAARLGGDEFVLVLPQRSGHRVDARCLQAVMDAIAAPVSIEGHNFFLTCSLGVAKYPADGEDPELLIKHADIAMYRAKQSGRNNFQFYTPAMNEQALERLHIESNLRAALERGEFVLHYQPKVDIVSGRVTGMEALIRWSHPELGMVPPGRFIGLAEETGLIVPIGAWVTRTACAQNKAWQDAGLPPVRVSVNLSARQFAQKNLVQSIAAVLHETGLEPHYLEIELTESLVMTDVEHAIEMLRQLKLLGVKLSIDDFGTGYSSLAYLKRFPIDVLKIDQSFVRDIAVDFNDAAITVSIISLGHNLKLKVIAEGVETEEQLAYLRHHGCDEVQGYLFSRPLAAAEFEAKLRENAAASAVPLIS
ncbi:EAL domain-containing protein [Oxalobacteraceae bacterium CAVE-383]|nr:EAL domain-containing protein [Oxalobacteraceae bacterium CAVE-383]